RERRTVQRALANRLVEEDDPADVVLHALRGEEHVAVGPAVLLGRLDPDRGEALLDRAVALVGGQDPFPVRDDGPRDLMQLMCSHFLPSVLGSCAKYLLESRA